MPSGSGLTSRILPDRAPTWTDVVMAALALVWLPVQLRQTSPQWGWVAAGFASVWVALGPLARTGVGERVDAWFTRIGVAGRAIAITTVAVVLWGVIAVSEPSRGPVLGFSVGIFAAIPPFVCLHVLVAGTPDRWRSE